MSKNQLAPIVNPGLPEDIFTEILPVFIMGGEILTAEISELIQSGTEDSIKDSAHKLAGTALSYGANKLANICKKIQKSSSLEEIKENRMIELMNAEWKVIIDHCANLRFSAELVH